VAGDRIQVAEVHSGRSYQSHYGMRLHFGLGEHRQADSIHVRWIGGGEDTRSDVAGDRVWTFTEGASPK
jgi:hypothetical protein